MWGELLPIAATAVLSVVTTLVATKYANKKSRDAEFEKQSRQHTAIYTALFAIRNFIVESLNRISEEPDLTTDEVPVLRIALDRLDDLIAKAPVERDDMAMALYDLPLRLKSVIVLIEERVDNTRKKQRLVTAINELIASLEQLDLFFGADLQIISEEDLQKFAKYPPD